MNAVRARAARRLLQVLSAVLALAVGAWAGPAAAQSFARPPRPPSVFALVTMDRITWEPYEYGTGFFFDAAGDAYTASSIVRDAVKDPYLVLIALVVGRTPGLPWLGRQAGGRALWRPPCDGRP